MKVPSVFFICGFLYHQRYLLKPDVCDFVSSRISSVNVLTKQVHVQMVERERINSRDNRYRYLVSRRLCQNGLGSPATAYVLD